MEKKVKSKRSIIKLDFNTKTKKSLKNGFFLVPLIEIKSKTNLNEFKSETRGS